jgi:hypothetical protein
VIEVTGTVVQVTEHQSKKSNKAYKRLCLLSNGGAGRPSLENVMDLTNGKWDMGAVVKLEVQKDLQIRNGVAELGWLYFSKGGNGELGSSAPPSVGSAGATAGNGGAAKPPYTAK